MRAGSDLADGSCGYMLSCAVNLDFKNTLYDLVLRTLYTHRPSLHCHTPTGCCASLRAHNLQHRLARSALAEL